MCSVSGGRDRGRYLREEGGWERSHAYATYIHLGVTRDKSGSRLYGSRVRKLSGISRVIHIIRDSRINGVIGGDRIIILREVNRSSKISEGSAGSRISRFGKVSRVLKRI